jgi:ElaB/YqjD/DUF883 family membrane-anchored ribosome-binding protein
MSPVSTTTDNASHLIEQASQSADQAIRATQLAANSAVDSAAVSLQDLRHQAVPLLERAGAMAHRGMDSVRDTSHQLRVKAEHASDTTVNYIKEEPVKAVLIAAATGAALMALVTLVARSRSHS